MVLDETRLINIYQTGISNWMSIWTQSIQFFFTSFIVIYAINNTSFFTAQSIGLLLTHTATAQSTVNQIFWGIKYLRENMVAYSRCREYMTIESEIMIKPDASQVEKEKDWPSVGKIEFVDFSVKYRPDTPLVLKDISFTVEPKKKVGIVGRTGSGKSTLGISLFRILEAFSGKILIDAKDITDISLRKLRSSMTIIPQDPILFKGTLKFNLDPLETKSDQEIESIMKEIGIWYLAKEHEKGLNMMVI